MRLAFGRASANSEAPPITQTSSAPSSSACSRAICTASEKSSQAMAPFAWNEPSRESTILVRPGSGLSGRLSQVLRPMITGFPMVRALKFCRSVFSRQGRSPPRPITPLRSRAMGPAVRMTLDMVAASLEVLRRLPHGGDHGGLGGGELAAGRLRPGGVDDDHQFLVRDRDDRLTED